MTYTFEVPPLGPDNWEPWKKRITAILRARGLLSYVEDTTPRPDPETESEAYEKWCEKDASAQALLVSAIADSEMGHISGTETAADIWRRLSDAKEPSLGEIGLEDRLGHAEIRKSYEILALRRELFHTVAKEGDDIEAHLGRLRDAWRDLNRLGSELPAKELYYQMLISLPPSWDTFVKGVLIGVRGDIIGVHAEELYRAILSECRRVKHREKMAHLTSRARNRGPSPTKKSSGRAEETEKCTNCGKPGHRREECWSKGGGRAGQGQRQTRGKGVGNDRADHARDIGLDLPDVAY
jgi:hypothetical protein